MTNVKWNECLHSTLFFLFLSQPLCSSCIHILFALSVVTTRYFYFYPSNIDKSLNLNLCKSRHVVGSKQVANWPCGIGWFLVPGDVTACCTWEWHHLAPKTGKEEVASLEPCCSPADVRLHTDLGLESCYNLNLYYHFYHSAWQVKGALTTGRQGLKRLKTESRRDLRKGLGVVEMRSDSQELLDFIHHCCRVSSQLMAIYDHHLQTDTFIL